MSSSSLGGGSGGGRELSRCLVSFDVGWFGGCFEFGAFLSNSVQRCFEFDAIRCCSFEFGVRVWNSVQRESEPHTFSIIIQITTTHMTSFCAPAFSGAGNHDTQFYIMLL